MWLGGSKVFKSMVGLGGLFAIISIGRGPATPYRNIVRLTILNLSRRFSAGVSYTGFTKLLSKAISAGTKKKVCLPGYTILAKVVSAIPAVTMNTQKRTSRQKPNLLKNNPITP